MGMVLCLIPAVAGLSIDSHATKLVGAVLREIHIEKEFLSYIPFQRYVPFISIFLGSSILLIFARCLKHKFMAFLLIVLTVGIGFFYGSRFIFPLIDPYKSARFLSLEILRTVKPGDKLAMYGGFAIGPYNFYTDIVPILDLENEDDLVSYFSSKERGFCLIQTLEYERLREKDLRIPLNLITRRRVGDKDIVLISN
jgi:hypothetical protein